jgi:uncharacterized membrane protein YhhN
MENSTLASLIVAVVIALFYGVYWLARTEAPARSLFKTLPVLVLAVAAWIGEGPLLLVAALFLSASGDFFLSRRGNASFMAGLGSFLTAHLAFIALFITLPAILLPTAGITISIWLFTIALMAFVLRSLWRHLAEMKIPVFIYSMAIGAMNISAWMTDQDALLLFGVALFVFSDIILAHELFVWKNPTTKLTASYAVWFSYFSAQAVIFYSFV